MKRLLAILMVLFLCSSTHAELRRGVKMGYTTLAVFSGVTMHISTVAGTAFISNCSVDLRPYQNRPVTITSTTGNYVTAYVGEAGSGETLTNVITNSGYEGTYTDGIAPNCDKIRGYGYDLTGGSQRAGDHSQGIGNLAGNTGAIRQWYSSISAGQLYKMVIDLKTIAGSGGWGALGDSSAILRTTTASTGAWATTPPIYATVTAGGTANINGYCYAVSNATAETNKCGCDELYVWKVTSPSDNSGANKYGVWLTSTRGGATKSLASSTGSFNPNASSFTITIGP